MRKLAFLAPLALTACAVGPNYVKPETKVSDQFANFNAAAFTQDQTVTIKTLDPEHPAAKPWGAGDTFKDEIYQHKNFDPTKVHVVIGLDMAKTALKRLNARRRDRRSSRDQKTYTWKFHRLLCLGSMAKRKEHCAKREYGDFFLHVYFFVSLRLSLDT